MTTLTTRQSGSFPDSRAFTSCTCAFTDMKDGSKFFTIRDRNCPQHGDDKLDWRTALELSGRMIPPDPRDVLRGSNAADVEGRFGRIP